MGVGRRAARLGLRTSRACCAAGSWACEGCSVVGLRWAEAKFWSEEGERGREVRRRKEGKRRRVVVFGTGEGGREDAVRRILL